MLWMTHESRSGDRGFQILCSRRLKLDGFNYVGDPYLAPVLECRLRPQYVSFPQLGERESFCLLDSDLKLVPGEHGAEALVILAAQVRVRISELHHTVEPPRTLQDRCV